MPAQKTINPSACVRAYPVSERQRLIWVWPGDPALADPSALPDFHWNDGAEWKGEGGTFYTLKCDYRLVVDNLMDLTHETYVHSGSIGHDAINEGKGVYDQDHAVLEAQQRAIDRNPRQPFYNLNIDAGALWARRLIDAMLTREQGSAASGQAAE